MVVKSTYGNVSKIINGVNPEDQFNFAFSLTPAVDGLSVGLIKFKYLVEFNYSGTFHHSDNSWASIIRDDVFQDDTTPYRLVVSHPGGGASDPNVGNLILPGIENDLSFLGKLNKMSINVYGDFNPLLNTNVLFPANGSVIVWYYLEWYYE